MKNRTRKTVETERRANKEACHLMEWMLIAHIVIVGGFLAFKFLTQ